MLKSAIDKNSVILWKDLLDLGIESALGFLQKKRTKEEAIKELRTTLLRQSQEHWQALYNALKRLK